MNGLALFLAAVVGALIHIFWGGYVLAVLWAWFAVPLGAVPITALHAAGLQCLLNTFLGSRGSNNDHDSRDTEEKIYRALFFPILLPAFGLFIGWVIHSWM